ncbi:TRY3 protein, partial [Sagittarius serpentarius]|nr:TRY3 protein [Sagittarius serpentarius]
GEHDLGCLDGMVQQWLATRLILHPRYNRTSKGNDLMLVKLRQPAAPGGAVQSVPLGTRCPDAGSECVISGWGNTSSAERTTPKQVSLS